MDKFNLVGITAILFISSSFIALYHTDIAEAIYSIPPTDAWDQIIFKYDTWTVTNEDNINATGYTDDLYLISDGSILFNVTTYP